ncbi:MAG: S-methyl-5-thioribose-1-phosphate isomerase [Candidatus Methanomethylicia archaeon]
MKKLPQTIEWVNGIVRIVDQTVLPKKLKIIECKTENEIIDAIIKMKVRGAPAIGAAASMALALTAKRYMHERKEEFIEKLYETSEKLKKTRPTAINLFWAINRILQIIDKNKTTVEIANDIINETTKIVEEDIKANNMIGENGEKLIENGDKILTYCNAGSLATVYYGTALGVIRSAWKNGKNINIFVAETRPQLQGARITAFELKRERIPFFLITDNMIGLLMQKGMINKVIVGADRILYDGTTYNKIGTYTIAVLSKHHNIPFYVAAPFSTFDFKSSKDDVKIEERSPEEVTKVLLKYNIAPKRTKALNYAFDMTPPEYITAIITDKGIIFPPYIENIRKKLYQQ